MTHRRLFDRLAIGASAVCLVHCLALPLILLMIPTLAVFLTIPESFHLGVFAFAVPTSLLTLWVRYRQHCRVAPALSATVPAPFGGLEQHQAGYLKCRPPGVDLQAGYP